MSSKRPSRKSNKAAPRSNKPTLKSNKPAIRTKRVSLKKKRPTTPKQQIRTLNGNRLASDTMSVTELQFMARSLGIPFGGLNKHMLINKINKYS